MINIRLLFFGRLREAFSCDGENLQLSMSVVTVADVIALLAARGNTWAVELAAGRALGFAIDQRFAQLTDSVHDGAEVAIFPPVTGG